ncbi:MAG TPA: hypothetical protein VM598_05170, partial [Bdellovibrionota bacterium]|nr:hypothetical protein [Bdellovibrionota bacterium]
MVFHRVFSRLSWRRMFEAADLFCLSCLVLAQPVLNVLAKNPEFFPIRRLGGADIVFLVFMLCFAIPAILHGLLWVLGNWRGRGAAHVARAAVVGTFAGLFFLQTIHDLGRVGGAPKSALAFVVAVAFGLLYFRFQAPKTFVAALSPAIVVIPVAFLLFSPVRPLLVSAEPPSRPLQAQGAGTPIVMLVFDGLSSVALLGKDGQIDSTLFPNFAALARQSNWYRTVWAKWDRTERAAPAILTGRFPDPPKPPTYASHPENLFTYL